MAIENPNYGIYAQSATIVSPLEGVVDLYPDEDHGVTIDATDKPIETGARLTDHAIVRPDTLTLEGYVSDVQVYRESLTNLQGAPRATEALQRIEQIAKQREPVEVITGRKIYPSVLILSIRSRRSADTGGALVFTMTMREVLFADTQLLALPPSRVNQTGPAANKTSTVDAGRKQSITDPQGAQRVRLLNDTSGYRGR